MLMAICAFVTFVIVVNLLHVSVAFCDHLQGSVFATDILQGQTNQSIFYVWTLVWLSL